MANYCLINKALIRLKFKELSYAKTNFISFFSFVLLLFSGCHSETPISPNDQDISLAKGRPLKVTGNFSEGPYRFLDINLEWSPFKKFNHYKVIWYHYLVGNEIYDTTNGTTFTAQFALPPFSCASCEVTVQAIKINRKGEQVVAVSSTKTFTYTGDAIPSMEYIEGYLTDGDIGEVSFGALFDEPSSAVSYVYCIYPSWYPTPNMSAPATPSIGYCRNEFIPAYTPPEYGISYLTGVPAIYNIISRTGQVGDFISVTVWACTDASCEDVVGIGHEVIEYVP